MDYRHVYDYPPDLFEVLTDAIPAMFRSKIAVIDFFSGAGVSAEWLRPWRAMLASDRNSVRKHELVRSILTKLNAEGDKAIRTRREVLKRVVEFDDFSTCWESERYKAEALVQKARQIINVKDTFTRLDRERERERRERQSLERSKHEAAQALRVRRNAVKSSLFELFRESDAQKRGKALEHVLNELFDAFGISISESFCRRGENGEGVVEQIDGAIELDGQTYLVEMKWWSAPIGRAEISPHLVSVFNRGSVRGICISYSGFTDPAISTVKEALSQRTIVLCRLDEMVAILETEAELKEILRTKVRAASLDKNPHLIYTQSGFPS